jgi:hypothetical protein
MDAVMQELQEALTMVIVLAVLTSWIWVPALFFALGDVVEKAIYGHVEEEPPV